MANKRFDELPDADGSDGYLAIEQAGGTKRVLRSALGGGGSAPVPLTRPVISGTPNVGLTVTASTGTWAPWDHGTLSYAYQWKLNGVAIGGETGSTYLIDVGDVGEDLTVTVTATDDNGSTAVTSAVVVPTFVTTTLSPTFKASNIVLSNGDLTMNGYYMVHSVAEKTSGKVYYEVTLGDSFAAIGFASSGSNTGTHPGGTAESFGVDSVAGMRARVGNSQVATGGSAMAAGQVISVLIDLDARTVEVYQNGTLAITYTYPGGITHPIRAAFGSDSSTTLTVNFGASPWAYPAIPSGAGAIGWTA